MPRRPSAARVPPHYRVPPETLDSETETLKFHRVNNYQNYMRWYTIAAKVDPEKTYVVTNSGVAKEVLTGDKLLDHIFSLFQRHHCTFVNRVREVPPEYSIPIDQLWQTVRDPSTGRTVVAGDHQDIWDTAFFTEIEPHYLTYVFGFVNIDDVMRLTDLVIQRRIGDYPPTRDFDAIRDLTRLAVINGLYTFLHSNGDVPNAAHTAGLRACEAFDRAFGYARIAEAGVNLTQYPEFHRYQPFYDAGMAPPTHAEMADYIIEKLANNEKAREP